MNANQLSAVAAAAFLMTAASGCAQIRNVGDVVIGRRGLGIVDGIGEGIAYAEDAENAKRVFNQVKKEVLSEHGSNLSREEIWCEIARRLQERGALPAPEFDERSRGDNFERWVFGNRRQNVFEENVKGQLYGLRDDWDLEHLRVGDCDLDAYLSRPSPQ